MLRSLSAVFLNKAPILFIGSRTAELPDLWPTRGRRAALPPLSDLSVSKRKSPDAHRGWGRSTFISSLMYVYGRFGRGQLPRPKTSHYRFDGPQQN